MQETKINLGRGMLANSKVANYNEMINLIEDFGIKLNDLNRINPTVFEITKIYDSIVNYRVCVRYLKELKNRFDINQYS